MSQRVAWVLLLLLMASSLMVVAYRPFMNETGNIAYGLRVVFSEPVVLTGFGDTLSEVSPDGISEEYLFTGGEVYAWTGVHWVSWEPAHAQVESHEWIMTPPGAEPSGEQGGVASVQDQTTEAPEGMVLIPAGSFQMGDHFSEGWSAEGPVRSVYVSAFYMDKHEVTVTLWEEVAAWAQDNGYDIRPSDGRGTGVNHPVTAVSWYEAAKWANARSEKEGLTPVYYTEATHRTVYRTGHVDVKNEWVKWTADGYRLPTEAEWEKAARGGLSGRRYPWGDAIDCSKANYMGCVGSSSPVGSYAPNGYGLYDMAGNVFEWVWDRYSSVLPAGADPRGPASGSGRTERGGSWSHCEGHCRVAVHFNLSPLFESYDLGFRLVRTAP